MGKWLLLGIGLMVWAMMAVGVPDSAPQTGAVGGGEAVGPVVDPGAGPVAPPVTGEQGLEGEVLIGPTCPVARPDNPCPDRPFAAGLEVFAVGAAGESGARVAALRSDDAGRFRVALAPGRYRVRPQTEGIARAPETVVDVKKGEWAKVRIVYDSGMR